MSTHQPQGSLGSRFHKELERVIADENLATLTEVIKHQSQSRLRDDVLADALAISCAHCYHVAVHYILSEERASPNLASKSIEQTKGVPPLVLAVVCSETPFRKDSTPTTEASHEPSTSLLKRVRPLSDLEGLKTIETLLEHGASLIGHDPKKRNALSYVVRAEVVELLLAQRGEDERQKALHDQTNNDGNDALLWAIISPDCNDSVALSFVKYGANKHTVDNEGRTTLMNAAWRKRTSVVEMLLQDKSIAKKKDKRGRNIWHHIASDKTREQSDDITKLLFSITEIDTDVHAIDLQGQTSLHLSAIFGTRAIAEELLAKKYPRLNAVEKHEKKTALHFAAANGDANFVKILLESGANRFAECDGGLMPIHLVCACDKDAVSAAKSLLEQEAERQLESRTEDKLTPLHIAAAHGNEAMVNLILHDYPPRDIDSRCEGGWTALHLACGRHMSASNQPTRKGSDSTQDPSLAGERAKALALKYLAVVHALLSAGAMVNRKSRLSRTPLHIAAEMGHVDIVKILLQQPDIQFAAKDSRGNTPLIDAARSKEREPILQLLAPWNDLFIQSLPENVKQAAKDYDANVVDFQKAADTKILRHKMPVFNVLYHDPEEAGALGREHVSTRPDPSKEGAFRWIHLPANNLHWCHTLLTKHFIECGSSEDVESFKALERSLSQQQYRGRRIHSRFMRPACTKLVRRTDDRNRGHVHQSPTQISIDELGIVSMQARGRINSTQVPEPNFAPPPPKAYTDLAARDFNGLHLDESGPQAFGRTRTHHESSKPLHLETSNPVGQPNKVLGSSNPHAAKVELGAAQKVDDPSKISDVGACLFMPYLTLESGHNVSTMHDQLPNDRSPRNVTNAGTDLPRSKGNILPRLERDAQLHQAYAEWKTNDYCLHVRRTLDQFWYRNVDTRERDRNQVVQRYQRNEQKEMGISEQGDVNSLMVDQLWIWILGPSLIVTSFPQDWQHLREEMPELLSSILEEIDPRAGTPAQSVYELAACIVGHCLSSCDQNADQEDRSSVVEMFGSSVGDVMNQEVMLFSRFKEASVTASEWVKRTLLDNSVEGTKQLQDLENDYVDKVARNADLQLGTSKSSHRRYLTATDEPKFVEDLLDIHDETTLLEEVKDIQDELGILEQVVDDQLKVHGEITAAFQPMMLRSESGPHQLRSSNILDEQCIFLKQQQVEIKNMTQQVKSTYKSITDLLDHKQKHANAIEARYARKQAADTAAQGRTLMVFTIVTVIFLPLSFLAAFFAITIDDLPYDTKDKLSLAFIMKYVVGVGLGTALAFVLLAWHHHRAVHWIKIGNRWLRGYISTLFRSGKKPPGQVADHGRSDRSAVSPASSSTLRSRRTNSHNDLEKGRDSVS
jgi:ankyrin repeat protein/Mg2+ and Co2+ transporter CorA